MHLKIYDTQNHCFMCLRSTFQYLRSNGENVTVEEKGGRSWALRLALSWEVLWTSCASQIEDSNNKVGK